MVPNQTMRCAQCLKAEVSIVEGISRQVALPRCRNCSRYNRPPWTKCEPESRELLGICLKRIRGINKDVRLVDATFIWTEEHSMRIKVKITVQREVAQSSVLQQTMVVEFTVINQQCEECQKSFTPHGWSAIVQVRQKVLHRRALIMLEQLILKHNAHEKVVSLEQTPEGLDFHFAQKSHGQRFADFVGSQFPSHMKQSKKLISHDCSSNVWNYKYTIFCELCPVCPDDLVYVPKEHARQLSGASQLMLCYKVSTAIRLMDPITMRSFDIAPEHYFKRPVKSISTRQHMTEFIVLNIELVEEAKLGTPQNRNVGSRKHALADIEVARVQDFGVNDERYIVRSHLGNILRIGNRVMGYDLRYLNLSGLDSEHVDVARADFFLVRRSYKKRKGWRSWELLRMDKTANDDGKEVNDDKDMEAVKQDLEEDEELRKNVNMYRNKQKGPKGKAAGSAPAATADDKEDEDDEEDDAPEVPLAELLEGLELRDDDDDA